MIVNSEELKMVFFSRSAALQDKLVKLFFNASQQRLSGLLTTALHASLEGLELSAYVLLSSSCCLRSMRSSMQKKSVLGQSKENKTISILNSVNVRENSMTCYL